MPLTKDFKIVCDAICNNYDPHTLNSLENKLTAFRTATYMLVEEKSGKEALEYLVQSADNARERVFDKNSLDASVLEDGFLEIAKKSGNESLTAALTKKLDLSA